MSANNITLNISYYIKRLTLLYHVDEQLFECQLPVFRNNAKFRCDGIHYQKVTTDVRLFKLKVINIWKSLSVHLDRGSSIIQIIIHTVPLPIRY